MFTRGIASFAFAHSLIPSLWFRNPQGGSWLIDSLKAEDYTRLFLITLWKWQTTLASTGLVECTDKCHWTHKRVIDEPCPACHQSKKDKPQMDMHKAGNGSSLCIDNRTVYSTARVPFHQRCKFAVKVLLRYISIEWGLGRRRPLGLFFVKSPPICCNFNKYFIILPVRCRVIYLSRQIRHRWNWVFKAAGYAYPKVFGSERTFTNVIF